MDNIMMVSKKEKEDTVLQLDLMKNNVVDNDSMTDLEDACQGGLPETSTQAVAVHLNLEDFGEFKYKVQSTRFCQYSPYTGWHLKRNEVMNIKIINSLKLSDPVIVRAILIRQNPVYRMYTVDQVCEKHREKMCSSADRVHVLQAAPGSPDWYYDDEGPRKSLCFEIGIPNSGFLATTIGLKCVCNDTCVTTMDPSFTATEASRDLMLVLTLESKTFRMVVARRSLMVWPKAAICDRDMRKLQRRKAKGGAAVADTRKRINTEKINLQSRPSTRLLVDVASNQKKPTIDKIVQATIGYGIQNAIKFGMSMEKVDSYIALAKEEPTLAVAKLYPPCDEILEEGSEDTLVELVEETTDEKIRKVFDSSSDSE